MAKRKGVKTAGVKRAKPKKKSKPAASARTRRAAKTAGARKAAATRGRKTSIKRAKVAKSRKSAAVARKKTPSVKAVARRTPARKTAPKKAAAKKPSARAVAAKRPRVAKAASIRRPQAPPPRKAPSLNRDRRVVRDDDVVQTPPSTLDLDRTASAARSGRRELRERFDEHTETGPTLTGGDIDGDWESAYSVGDEAPGGDSPTPDQDIVDDIGRAVGVEYQDNEELKGDEKIASRDRHRWELDPASAEDYDEH